MNRDHPKHREDHLAGDAVAPLDAFAASVDGSPAAGCPSYGPSLDDYVDGVLDADRQGEVEAHLQSCRPCRDEVDGLRRLLLRAAELPSTAQPRRDLWQDIAPRLKGRNFGQETPYPEVPKAPSQRSRTVVTAPWWAQFMAACLLMLVGYSVALWYPPSRGTEQGLAEKPEPGDGTEVASGKAAGRDLAALASSTPSFGFVAAEVELLRAKQSLLMVFMERQGEMPTETFELVRRNLEIIDQATRELHLALSQDPDNPRLEGRVLDNYRRELSLLRRLTGNDV